ncbi:hypothetical protein NPIL_106311 [Nephila pilipes]|uniref:Uncharacterized protein n=1 Tax=Nephila pilipes TaxID=299642 RepID=A0A8X6P955_NEPPI|nr:hypothetical protein NPIL_106311 [Nephila pilipes]
MLLCGSLCKLKNIPESVVDGHSYRYLIMRMKFWSTSSGRLISPRIRHFHPRLMSYEDGKVVYHHVKRRGHIRRSHGYTYTEPTTTETSTNSTKITCRDETQPFNGTEDEICPQFAQDIGNVTQATGRVAKLDCVVDNLGRFRYVEEAILQGDGKKRYHST